MMQIYFTLKLNTYFIHFVHISSKILPHSKAFAISNIAENLFKKIKYLSDGVNG